MYKTRETVAEYLHRGNDIAILKSIYEMRCLNVEQIRKLHSGVNCEELLFEFLCAGFLSIKKHPKGYAYMLTTFGVSIVRYAYDLPHNEYYKKKQIMRRGYYRARELDISPNRLNRLLSWNDRRISGILHCRTH